MEYRTRLWMGSLMLCLATGMLILDQFTNWYPFLLLLLLLLGPISILELLNLFRKRSRPSAGFCIASVFLIHLANWPPRFVGDMFRPWLDNDPWHWILVASMLVVVTAFIIEIISYRQSRKRGRATERISLTLFTVVYIGILPCFLVQLRWSVLPDGSNPYYGVAALAFAIFVPKFGDIGAYVAGRLFGRHLMAPRLSPKKTYEGLVGGLLLAALVSVLINRWQPLLGGDLEAAAFGLVVGTAGVIGDLAESLIKREGQQKDASQSVPGFGGVLDVIDSVLFAAPVVYFWLRR